MTRADPSAGVAVRAVVAVTIWAALAAPVAAPVVAQPGAQPGALPPSRLSLRDDRGVTQFWHADHAPAVWRAAPLANAVQWRAAAPGVETAELTLAGTGEAWRTRLVLARLDPHQLTFALDTAATAAGRPAWNTGHVPAHAVFAVNAGQFRSTLPWGLVVLNGRQMLPAEEGPLAVTIAVDSTGAVRWMPAGERRPGGLRWAFQSYPALLHNREVPAPLRAAGRGVDVQHRDARIAIGRLESGALLVALTRFDGLGGFLGAVPFGLTTPEMAAVMGALGAVDAVLLDGGISAQLVAGTGRDRIVHSGWRNVPLALVAFPAVVHSGLARSPARAPATAPPSQPRRVEQRRR